MDSFVAVDGWKVNIRFSAAHILPGFGKCSQLHGHTYALSVKVYGKKNEDGVIVDFHKLKSILGAVADELDHKVLVPEKNRMVAVDDQEIRMTVDKKIYVLPLEDCVLLPLNAASAESIAEYVCDEVIKQMDMPQNVYRVEVSVDEGLGQSATTVKEIQ
jgi:6-pyruvoyltetrahydropterin/6-carboxytetrahydropterin synthase